MNSQGAVLSCLPLMVVCSAFHHRSDDASVQLEIAPLLSLVLGGSERSAVGGGHRIAARSADAGYASGPIELYFEAASEAGRRELTAQWSALEELIRRVS